MGRRSKLWHQKTRSRLKRRRATDAPWYERRQHRLPRALRDLQRLYWLACKRCNRAGVPIGRPGSRSAAVRDAMQTVRGLQGAPLRRALRALNLKTLDRLVDDGRRPL